VPNVNLPFTLKLGCLTFTLTTGELSNCLCFMSNPYFPTLFCLEEPKNILGGLHPSLDQEEGVISGGGVCICV
jgi:hypothetical protein